MSAIKEHDRSDPREARRSAVLDEVEALRKKLKVKRRFKIADLIAEGRL
jgi:hypothetical protein